MVNLSKRYDPAESEKKWQQYWEDQQVYRWNLNSDNPVYSIDTPPPTVSGDLHMGHCYSYSQPDFYARFYRMNGYNVFYPMGFDDNGLPTERLVEDRLGITPDGVGTETFIREIINISRKLEENYEQLWKMMGLSVDWEQVYTTISPRSRKAAQYSFIDLYRKERIYRSSSPSLWCPACRTAIAQAEVDDLNRETTMITIRFGINNSETIPIATTRPELLPACVAVFVNPDDNRYRNLIGKTATTPLFNKEVPILADKKADPEKGTGIVMCCTFGDTTDIKWWREHDLPLLGIIGAEGTLNDQAGFLAGLDIKSARRKIIEELQNQDLVMNETAVSQTVSVHERCDTPVEYVETKQWFVKVMDRKDELLEAGRKIRWHPGYMLSRYEDWVNNLEWDWCISRQRYHGVPFPLWYCSDCGRVILAEDSALPVNPGVQSPTKRCECGSNDFVPEPAIMDTWMTSSMTPQIAGKWLDNSDTFSHVFPMSLRPQSHDIIRTWAFTTIVKSFYHFDEIPWADIGISGHGLSPEGHKLSKSRAVNVSDPLVMMEKYSADAVRYWAASSRLGEDSIINEDKIAAGQKLVTKLWNVARFSSSFILDFKPPETVPLLLPTDKWVLSELQQLISDVSVSYRKYDHLTAKNRIEGYFWNTVADNYLEMVKSRLYDQPDGSIQKESARYTLYKVLNTVLKLLASVMPYITEEIYQVLFTKHEDVNSIHLAKWPVVNPELEDGYAGSVGKVLVEIATQVRRYKSENELPMSAKLQFMRVTVLSEKLRDKLNECITDIGSVTRVDNIELVLSAIKESHETDSSNVQVRIEQPRMD
ncbi:MAG: valine--tRNA ligase [Dehalococcoidales bacterium]|nr:MAG: valine--tRNA ligase [Dehalococcoidales bacterium]